MYSSQAQHQWFGAFFPNILTSICYLFIFGTLLRWGETSWLPLFAFPWWLMTLSMFSCIFGHFNFILWKVSIQIHSNFLTEWFILLLSFWSSLCNLSITLLSDVYLQMLSPILSLLNVYCVEAAFLDVIYFLIFSPLLPMFLRSYPRTLCLGQSLTLMPLCFPIVIR